MKLIEFTTYTITNAEYEDLSNTEKIELMEKYAVFGIQEFVQDLNDPRMVLIPKPITM